MITLTLIKSNQSIAQIRLQAIKGQFQPFQMATAVSPGQNCYIIARGSIWLVLINTTGKEDPVIPAQHGGRGGGEGGGGGG